MWSDSKLLWLIFSALVVGILEFLSFANIRLPSVIELPFFFTLIVIVGYRTLWHGLHALFTLDFKSIQALMLLAVVGAWYLGKYEEAAVVIVLYTLAEKLEDIGIEKSQTALNSLLEKMPKLVYLKNTEIPIPVEEVKMNAIFLVKPGEMIALDGKISHGFSFVDESSITGEPIPQEKFVADLVYAGTLNKQGFLEVEVLKTYQNTTFAKIKELTFHATQVKAPTQKLIEKFSLYYTPTIFMLACLWIFIPTWFLGYPFEPWLNQGLSLLVIACPCALVISTPISIFSALGNASTRGILIKGGKYLEAMGQIKAIAMDKTRTLTYGRPIVSDIIPYGKNSKTDLLECAAGIEIFSEHPLAQSIVEAAKKDNLTIHPVENFTSIIGKGAQADCLVCSDRHHCLGKLQFILEEHIVPSVILEEVDSLFKEGKTVVLIATHQEIEGIIALTDEIRPESSKLIQDLKKMDIHPVLVTGDHFAAAQIVGKELGIDDIRAELLPEEKAEVISQLIKKYNWVAMVGDGVNDAPALAQAQVGISMNSLGSDTAIEASSIVILNDKLDVIPFLLRLGKRTIQIIRFNLGLAISIKLVFILLALMGMSNLALAIFADVGVTIIVILVSLTLVKYKS